MDSVARDEPGNVGRGRFPKNMRDIVLRTKSDLQFEKQKMWLKYTRWMAGCYSREH